MTHNTFKKFVKIAVPFCVLTVEDVGEVENLVHVYGAAPKMAASCVIALVVHPPARLDR
jgi:hypothetical protein